MRAKKSAIDRGISLKLLLIEALQKTLGPQDSWPVRTGAASWG
ncbi:MAG: hypothetical protein WA888_04550 [Burkholderiaceae bacterium]